MGKDIVPTDTDKDLGVILDSNLTYYEHIIKTASSYMPRLGQINRVKRIFDKSTLLMIIYSLVFSKLFYCSNVWANTSKCNITKLQAVQNFACRIVSAARANMTIFRPFVKSSIGSRWQTSYITVALQWPSNV